jgi:hypothetical protein
MQSRTIFENGGQRTFVVVLKAGEEVSSYLQEFVKAERIFAAQFTAIGALSDVVLKYYNWEKKEYEENQIREQVEVASLLGDVAELFWRAGNSRAPRGWQKEWFRHSRPPRRGPCPSNP